MFDFLNIFSDFRLNVCRAQLKSCPQNFAVFKEAVENVKLYSFFEYQLASLNQNSSYEKIQHIRSATLIVRAIVLPKKCF